MLSEESYLLVRTAEYRQNKNAPKSKVTKHTHVSGPSLPVPVELVSGDVFIVAPEYVDAPEC